MILSLEDQDLLLLDICFIGATLLFISFSLEVSQTTIYLLGLLCLTEQIMHCFIPMNVLAKLQLLSIQPFLRPSRPSNMLNLLYILASYRHILLILKKKFQCSMVPSFGHIGMTTDSPSFVYKLLHEY